jgi:outer membrane protein TolC
MKIYTRNIQILLILLFFTTHAPAQNDSLSANEVPQFTLDDFLAQVLRYHPVAKQSQLFLVEADQEVRMARGGFDPKLMSYFKNKEYANKEYYNNWDTYLKLPTWFGAEFKVGYERNTGSFVSPENSTPASGLWYAGLSVSVLQGLLIDERRTALRQAQLMRVMNEFERRSMLNKILIKANKDYWNWANSYFTYKQYEIGYLLAQERFVGTANSVIEGERAALDSVEAFIEQQNRYLQLQKAKNEFVNATLILSNYLWNENQEPLEIDTSIAASYDGSESEIWTPEEIEELIEVANRQNPDIQKNNIKIDRLKMEQRLFAEMLKPQFNVNFNLLQPTPLQGDNMNMMYFSNNYKWGFNASFPLFLRKERGKLQLTKTKVKRLNLELINQQRELATEIRTTVNELNNLIQLLTIQQQIVVNQQTLRDGEQIRFDNGESSIFLINARERKLIEELIKLIELRTKYASKKLQLNFLAGDLETFLTEAE